MSYQSQVKDYVKKVIRIRKRLIADNKSRMSKVLALHHINHLEKYLKAYAYDKDYQMAGFWIRNRGRVMDLLPGSGSNSHTELVNELNNIDSITMRIDAPSRFNNSHVH
jgi:hypothetical protein